MPYECVVGASVICRLYFLDRLCFADITITLRCHTLTDVKVHCRTLADCRRNLIINKPLYKGAAVICAAFFKYFLLNLLKYVLTNFVAVNHVHCPPFSCSGT